MKNDKLILLFKYQTSLGLRIGEACKLHLNNITINSLRHYAITKFFKANNGNIVLISTRHTSPNTTIRCIAKDNEQLYKEIDGTFSIENITILKKRI